MRRTTYCFAILMLAVAVCAAAQGKPIITVLDLQTEGVSAGEMKSVVSLLSSAFFKTGSYTVIDVTERDRLLKEVEFSVSDCTDQSCQLEIGKMLSAELIVMGNLNRVGSRYVLTLKMLETKSARTVGTADGNYGSLEGLIGDMANLAVTLRDGGSKLSGKAVAGIATLSGGVVAAGAGGVLIGLAAGALTGTVAQLYQAYQDLPAGSAQAAIDAAYAAYSDAFSGSRTQMIVGIAAAGAGLAALGTSVVLFLLPEDTEKPKATRMSVLPTADFRGITFRLSY
jgi:hypothetical protein